MNTIALKIVLDTNIFIAIIGKKSPFRWIFDCFIEGKLILCVSNEILFEYQEVLSKKTSPEVADNVVNFITVNPFTEKTEVFFNFDLISADADDNKFVDCAVASNAICLVSNDNHFQILKTIDFPKVTILTLSEFEAEYKAALTRNNQAAVEEICTALRDVYGIYEEPAFQKRMNFSEEFLRALCEVKVVGDFPPFDTGKIEDVQQYIKHILGQIGARKDVFVKADFDSYGSGFASYVAVKISKKDRSDTKITGTGNKRTEWTDGLELYISKLAPFWFWGGSDWTVNFEDDRRTGGSGGFLTPESVHDLNQEVWGEKIRLIEKIFEDFGYVLLTEEELSQKLWFEVKIPTILANAPYEVFDCFFYWED